MTALPARADYPGAEAAMQAGDFATAIPLLTDEAKRGNPVAAFNLGQIYEQGAGGVPVDFVQAATYYRIAATLDIPPAYDGKALGPQGPKLIEAAQMFGQFALGRLYEEGKGVPVDTKEAIAWYTRSADLGHQRAMLKLAFLYRDGAPDLAPNGETSANWLKRAAGLGNGLAMSELGLAYLKGLGGLPPNAKEAEHWFKEAAALGSVEADYNLGLIYQAGLLGQADIIRAAEHFERAANARDGLSMLALGDLYAAGTGVPRDLVQAHLWYNLAKDNGAAEGAERIGKILPHMTPADIASAEALYTAWRPRNADPTLNAPQPEAEAQPAAPTPPNPAAAPIDPNAPAPQMAPPMTPGAAPQAAPPANPSAEITTPDLPPLFTPNDLAPAPVVDPNAPLLQPQPYDPNNSGAPAPADDGVPCCPPPSTLVIPPIDTPPPPPPVN